MVFVREKQSLFKNLHTDHVKDTAGIREYKEKLIISHTIDYL